MIDEKKLIDELKQSGMIADNDYGNSLVNMINSQPTAYDLEKVVKELEELRDFKANQFNISKYGLMQMVIEFVKSGGIE
ncbi:MAG: hypothetical protein HDR09_11040 [Lachnospiraceae bacterium]|nr:hypothetical protein [Lachnospiraceae bacterium]